MNFEGFTPHEFDRWSSLVEQDDPTALPQGVAGVARNVSFRLSSVRTRDGIAWQFQTPTKDQPITGLASLINQQPSGSTQVPVILDMLGRMYVESPAGSATLVQVTSPQVSLPPNIHMQVAAAYNRGYLAFSDMKVGLANPAVYDLPSGNLDPYSMRPVGARWQANTAYQAGEVVTPATGGTVGNGHTYRCTVAGISGSSSPSFPTNEGGTVTDGGVTWTETTPVMAQSLADATVGIITKAPTVTRAAGAGTFAANRDVYIGVTLVNGNGETVLSTIFSYTAGTSANDRFVVTSPVLPTWVQQLTGSAAVTGYNVYEADVAHSGAAPAISAFTKVNGALISIGANQNVDTTGAGAAPPNTNTAVIVPAGNICSGQRYAIVLFKNRNGYITGMTEASVQGFSSPGNGFQIYMAHVPLGPANTAARIVCFTVSGGTTVGDYFYIPSQDSVSGVIMTSTVMSDNTTTSATFNFTDVYLLSTTKVTDFFRKVQAPACVDIYFSASLNRMVLTTPTGHMVSLAADPESFYGDTSPVQPGQLDGQSTICWRDFQGTSYSLKERSGYIVEVSATDPSTWQTVKKWEGVGPCGPRAAAVCNAFMCFAHRSGFYVFFGDAPQRVSKEIGNLSTSTWRRINWDYQHLIWIHIDEESQEVRIGVPVDGSTVPNVVLKVSYEESPSFGPPLFFSHFVGKEISSAESRKWSVDDIPAFVCARVERKLASLASGARTSMSGADSLTRQSQIMFGSSNPDGVVSAIDYGTYSDVGPNGTAGIDSVYEAVAPAELMRVNQLGGISVNAVGNGDLQVSIILGRQIATDRSNKIDLAPIKLDDSQAKPPKSVGGRGQNERMRPRFSNGKQPGAWFDLKYAVLYARPVANSK
ncbi:MAG TPA: hypothetical protein VI636_09770 [Candidatus Angelobacter sp.]